MFSGAQEQVLRMAMAKERERRLERRSEGERMRKKKVFYRKGLVHRTVQWKGNGFDALHVFIRPQKSFYLEVTK